MARTIREPVEKPIHLRKDHQVLVRPVERRHSFHEREAQRHLQKKEVRWAPIAYVIFLLAMLGIFSTAYTSYVFSKYTGEVLPGVYVDNVPLSGYTFRQAVTLIQNQTTQKFFHPVKLQYNAVTPWEPSPAEIGLTYPPDKTAQAAMDVGRKGSFFEQLLDRLPVHPSHHLTLQYTLDPHQTRLRAYVQQRVYSALSRDPVNARLSMDHSSGVITVLKSRGGDRLDVPATIAAIQSSLGYLKEQPINLKVDHPQPAITTEQADAVKVHVDRLLNNPPVIAVGKRVVAMSRADFGPLITFQNRPKLHVIAMTPNFTAVHAYISKLASGQIDRPAQDAKVEFIAGKVHMVRPARTGRQLEQDIAYTHLITAIEKLKSHARLRFPVKTIAPPVDQQNPADLGITTLLSSGSSSFVGAPDTRVRDIEAIAQQLKDTVIRPDQTISFNALVGTGWNDQVYVDQADKVNGKLVPGIGGGMQQIATTFLRALYAAGLDLDKTSLHTHTYRLPWYEPPYGLDAVVSPARGWDIVFRNNTHKNLILETDVQPIKQSVTIYVYGPKLGWNVTVDSGTLTKVIPAPPMRQVQNPDLAPGQVNHIAYGLDGGTTVIKRVVTLPNGDVRPDQITATYQARQPVDEVPQISTPTPTATPKTTGTPGTPTTPGPTPTFSH